MRLIAVRLITSNTLVLCYRYSVFSGLFYSLNHMSELLLLLVPNLVWLLVNIVLKIISLWVHLNVSFSSLKKLILLSFADLFFFFVLFHYFIIKLHSFCFLIKCFFCLYIGRRIPGSSDKLTTTTLISKSNENI